METQAKLRHLRIAPRKVRLVVDLIRGLEIEDALKQLKFIQKKAAKPVAKLINSSLANAEHNHKLKRSNLYIKEIRVDEGPSLKRWRPRAFGRAAPIQKRTSHITLILAEIKPTAPKEKDKAKPKEAPQAKVVKSLDEVKEKEKPFEEKGKPEKVKKTEPEKYRPEPVDRTRLGKDRDRQHLDKVRKKEKGGALKRIFRRKSV